MRTVHFVHFLFVNDDIQESTLLGLVRYLKVSLGPSTVPTVSLTTLVYCDRASLVYFKNNHITEQWIYSIYFGTAQTMI